MLYFAFLASCLFFFFLPYGSHCMAAARSVSVDTVPLTLSKCLCLFRKSPSPWILPTVVRLHTWVSSVGPQSAWHHILVWEIRFEGCWNVLQITHERPGLSNVRDESVFPPTPRDRWLSVSCCECGRLKHWRLTSLRHNTIETNYVSEWEEKMLHEYFCLRFVLNVKYQTFFSSLFWLCKDAYMNVKFRRSCCARQHAMVLYVWLCSLKIPYWSVRCFLKTIFVLIMGPCCEAAGTLLFLLEFFFKNLLTFFFPPISPQLWGMTQDHHTW